MWIFFSKHTTSCIKLRHQRDDVYRRNDTIDCESTEIYKYEICHACTCFRPCILLNHNIACYVDTFKKPYNDVWRSE